MFAVFCKNKKLFRSVCKSMIYKSLYKMEEKRIDALTTEGKKWKYNEKKSCAPSDIALGKFPRFLNIFVKCLRDSRFKSIFFHETKRSRPCKWIVQCIFSCDEGEPAPVTCCSSLKQSNCFQILTFCSLVRYNPDRTCLPRATSRGGWRPSHPFFCALDKQFW